MVQSAEKLYVVSEDDDIRDSKDNTHSVVERRQRWSTHMAAPYHVHILGRACYLAAAGAGRGEASEVVDLKGFREQFTNDEVGSPTTGCSG